MSHGTRCCAGQVIHLHRFQLPTVFRRRGYGTSILNCLISVYENSGCQSILVPTANSQGGRLYKKCGFKPNHQRELEYMCLSAKNQKKRSSMADRISVRPHPHTGALPTSIMAQQVKQAVTVTQSTSLPPAPLAPPAPAPMPTMATKDSALLLVAQVKQAATVTQSTSLPPTPLVPPAPVPMPTMSNKDSALLLVAQVKQAATVT